MTDMLNGYLPAILIVAVVALIVAFLLLRPRQRVRLSSDTPLRPHMTNRLDSQREASDIAAEAAAAACDVSGEIIGAPVHRHLGSADERPDDFQRIKGVGPRLADMLHAQGYTRFEQLARLSDEEVEMLDRQLGAFSGRIQRDRIPEQAQFLARGDTDGFEQRFGKL